MLPDVCNSMQYVHPNDMTKQADYSDPLTFTPMALKTHFSGPGQKSYSLKKGKEKKRNKKKKSQLRTGPRV